MDLHDIGHIVNRSRRRHPGGRCNRAGAAFVVAVFLGLFLHGCDESRPTGRWRPGFTGHELKVAGFGGSIQRQMESLAGSIFESLTGARVVFIKGTSRLHLKTLRAAKGGKAPFDIVLLDGIVQAMAARDDLLVKSTTEDIPEMENIVHQALPQVKGGPAFQFFSVGIAYDPASLHEAHVQDPASWSVFWRPELKGHVAVPSIYHTAGMDFVQAAAIVKGYDPGTLEGMKKAIDAIAGMKPALVYQSLGPLKQGLADGNIWIAPLYNSRAYNWISEGMRLKFVLPRERGFGHLTTINVVRNTQEKRLANLFISLVLNEGYQYAQAIKTPFGPVHSAVIDPLAHFPRVCERFPLGEEDLARLNVPDWNKVNRYRSEVEKYWFSKFPRK